MDNVFTAGEFVPYSGVYRITHHPPHASEEGVRLIEGNAFPVCVHCSQVSFMLVNRFSNSELLNYLHRRPWWSQERTTGSAAT